MIQIGEYKLSTIDDDSDEIVIFQWSAIWAFSTGSYTYSFPVLDPDRGIMLPTSFEAAIVKPGVEPLLVVDARTTDPATKRTASKVIRTRSIMIFSKTDGTAWLIYPWEPEDHEGTLNILDMLDEYEMTKSRKLIDVDDWEQFQLADLIGPKEMKKLASTAKQRWFGSLK